MNSNTEEFLRSIHIKAWTWHRDSSSLFDYECKSCIKSQLEITEASKIYRTKNELQTCPTGEEEEQILTEIELREGHFTLLPLHKQISAEKTWILASSLGSRSRRGYRLCEGDIIKLGRMKFKITELRLGPRSDENFSLSEMLYEEETESEEEDENETGIECRICLYGQNDIRNPLISPCKCSGTMKHVHLKCLKRGVRSKLLTKATANVVSFAWKDFSCDLCESSLPYKLKIGGKLNQILDIPKPKSRFIVLESFNKERGLHILSFNNVDEIKIGRSKDCGLTISDISVSRVHGLIKYVNNSYVLDDKQSKFGTLVEMKRPLAIEEISPVKVEIGRTLLVVSHKKPWSFWPTCFRLNRSPFDTFNKPMEPGVVPLFPLNTGIPVSVGENQAYRIVIGFEEEEERERREYGGEEMISNFVKDEELDVLMEVEMAKIQDKEVDN